MRQIVLDFSRFEHRTEVHRYLAEKLSFPEYYGGNLDALFDCLTEPMEDTAIYVFPAGKSFEAGFLRVLSEAAEENSALYIAIEKLP